MNSLHYSRTSVKERRTENMTVSYEIVYCFQLHSYTNEIVGSILTSSSLQDDECNCERCVLSPGKDVNSSQSMKHVSNGS